MIDLHVKVQRACLSNIIRPYNIRSASSSTHENDLSLNGAKTLAGLYSFNVKYPITELWCEVMLKI